MADVKEDMSLRYLTETEKLALEKLIGELRGKWPSAKFRLFGSKVTGTFDEESDLDLLILLPCEVTAEIRQYIVHKVFDINLAYLTNISALIFSEEEWNNGYLSVLPIHSFIEEEGVSL